MVLTDMLPAMGFDLDDVDELELLRDEVSNLREQVKTSRSKGQADDVRNEPEAAELRSQMELARVELANVKLQLAKAEDASQLLRAENARLEAELAARGESLAAAVRLSSRVCKSLHTAHESADTVSREHSRELACLRTQLEETQAQLEDQVGAAAASREHSQEQAYSRARLEESQVQLFQLRELLHATEESAAGLSHEHRRELGCLRAQLEGSQVQLKEKEALSDKQSDELREMRERLREEASRGVCCICFDVPSNVVLLPCRHKQTCGSCAASITCCPTCRAAIQQRLEVFE